MRRNVELKSKGDRDEIRAKREAAAKRWHDRRQQDGRKRVEAGERVGLAQVSPRKREADEAAGRPPRPPLRQGNGMAASREQQAKKKDEGACRILSWHEHDEPEMWPADVRAALLSWNGPVEIDSAHVAGPHGCTDRRCTIPLARPLHRAYDRHELNILRYLTREEEAHAAHERGILRALERISCCRMVPVANVADDRLRHMTYDEQAEVVTERGLVEALPFLTGVQWFSGPWGPVGI